MILLDRITKIPEQIDIKIPNVLTFDVESTFSNVLDCGNAEDVGFNIFFNGGYANSYQNNTLNCGWADTKSEVCYTLYVNGGGANDIANKEIHGGFADSIQKLYVNGGVADESECTKNRVTLILVHKMTSKKYIYNTIIKDKNDLYLTIPFTFSEIPPLGEYNIIFMYEEDVIYKGILRIGNIEHKNNGYSVEEKRYQYEQKN